MDTAFQYNRNTGLATYAQYPYVSGSGSNPACQTSVANNPSNLKNKQTVSVAGNNQSLQGAISKAAIAVAVDATNWSSYRSGVFNNCAANLNHGVIAVGYQENEYWLVRNSWGAGWGENGYIKLAWGNTCGIFSAASYVEV